VSTEKIIEVRDLGASFDGVEVLSNVSFTVNKGDVAVILGSSGCGKSTVLKHILGLYPLRKGVISVLGTNISTQTEFQQQELYKKLGVFYQNGALLNSMTVGENVGLPLAQHTSLPPEVIDEIVLMKLGLVNLDNAVNKYPSELSGGMLKRAALARAIVMDPPLLFCDEPGAGLDPISLESLDKLILNLKSLLGITIVMVTHEVSSILRVANRIIYLDQGKVVYEGNPKDAYKCGVQSVENFFAAAKSEF
jgi:phospholipid/cholesterol/gamma-HCH transport system ATP-binding protein